MNDYSRCSIIDFYILVKSVWALVVTDYRTIRPTSFAPWIYNIIYSASETGNYKKIESLWY